jgi:hypothetical protein
MLFRSILTGAAVLTAAGILAAPHAHAVTTITAGSSSDALSAVFTVNKTSDSLPNQAVATGKAPPKYDKTTKVLSYSKTASLSGLTLKVTAKNIVDTASSAGIDTKGGITAISGASIGSVNSTLSSPLGTAMTVKAGTLASSASFATTKAGVNTAKGSAAITALVITAPAFGIKNLTYSGKPAANRILYQNGAKTVIVYLNRQTTTTAGGKVTGISVSSVAVHVKNYIYAKGITVSADVDVATSTAN